MGKIIGKNISKNVTNKHILKLLDHAKKSATDALKTSSERVIQKTAEATGDLLLKQMNKYLERKIYITRIKTKNY